MLTFSEVRQLADKDLRLELRTTRDILFRQRMGVRTRHLKDNHMMKILKKYIAQLLTEMNRRRHSGEQISETSGVVVEKIHEFKKQVSEAQDEPKKTKEAKINSKDSITAAEQDSADVKVKKITKKGLFQSKAEK